MIYRTVHYSEQNSTRIDSMYDVQKKQFEEIDRLRKVINDLNEQIVQLKKVIGSMRVSQVNKYEPIEPVQYFVPAEPASSSEPESEAQMESEVARYYLRTMKSGDESCELAQKHAITLVYTGYGDIIRELCRGVDE